VRQIVEAYENAKSTAPVIARSGSIR